MMKKQIWLNIFLVMFVGVMILSWHSPVCAVDQAVIDGAKGEGKFVFYTSMPIEPAVALLDAFKKKYPFLDTSEYFRSNTYNVFSRINTETAAGQYLCDAVHIADIPSYNEWKKKGWLMNYDSPIYDGYSKDVIDRPFWAPLRTYALIMAYNTSILKGKEIPTTWAELADPKWKDKIGVEDIDSGSQHIIYYVLRRILGEGYWQKVTENRLKVYPGTGAMVNGLLRDEIRISLCNYCYVVYDYRELRKAPIQGIWPKEGSPISVTPLAIMAKAPHPNAAKLWFDWICSQEGQTAMVKLVGAYSGRKDVATAKGNPKWTEFKQLYVDDWDKYSADTESWQKFWKDKTRK